jgi:peptide/nickel transport system substrate-binding protein
MLRKLAYSFILITVVMGMLVGCGGGAAEPAEPTPTEEIINPPVIKEDDGDEAEPTATPQPTEAAEPEEEETEPSTSAGDETFSVNGVTMPFGRSEAVVMDQTNFAVFDSFNPFIPNGVQFAAGWWQISNEYLWYTNYATGDIIPWLATGYEYNDDYTELSIFIRKGVTWSDGEAFTADDVAFTMNMLKENENLSAPNDVDFWDNVYARDDFTVVFEMTEPRPRQHQLWWCKICTGQAIVPEHIWNDVDPTTFNNAPPVTTGPYQLMEVYPEQKVFVWERNEDYWGKSEGYFPAAQYVVYRTGPGAEQTLAEARDNNMDIFGMNYDTYVENRDEIPQINQVAYVDPCPRGAFFNTAQEPHLSQPAFRRALSMLMNRPKWAENIWAPPSKLVDGPWADYKNLDKYINEEANEEWGTLEYNPDRALSILEELGYTQNGDTLLDPNGEELTFEVSTPVAVGGNEYLMAQDFVQDLKDIGMNASLKHYEGGVFWDMIDNGDFDIGFWWMCGATVDPYELFNGYTCDRVVPIGEKTLRGNAMRFCDPEFDAIVSELGKVDPAQPEAMDLYMQAYDLFMKGAPGVPLIETYYTAYFNTTYWDNMMSNDNLYTVPFNWWGQIMFVLFEIEPK